MKVFISWSGDLSKEVAATIRDLFPKVLQGLQVFMSKDDIESGSPWFDVIRRNLAESDFGIIVATRQNKGQPWLLFEAGAIAVKVKNGEQPHVTPLLVDLDISDLDAPLGHYQAAHLNRDDMCKLLGLLNSFRDGQLRLSDTIFAETFAMWWPKLEDGFEQAKERSAIDSLKIPKRPPDEIVADVLTEVRALSRQVESSTNSLQNAIQTHHVQQLLGVMGGGTSLAELLRTAGPAAGALLRATLSSSGAGSFGAQGSQGAQGAQSADPTGSGPQGPLTLRTTEPPQR